MVVVVVVSALGSTTVSSLLMVPAWRPTLVVAALGSEALGTASRMR